MREKFSLLTVVFFNSAAGTLNCLFVELHFSLSTALLLCWSVSFLTVVLMGTCQWRIRTRGISIVSLTGEVLSHVVFTFEYIATWLVSEFMTYIHGSSCRHSNIYIRKKSKQKENFIAVYCKIKACLPLLR